MDLIFTVPTYARRDLKTMRFLQELGITKDRIVLSTQDKTDYQELSEVYGDVATVIFKSGSCVADNRNNILEYCRKNDITKFMMIDDDVSGMSVSKDIKTIRKISEAECIATLQKSFEVAERAGATIFGFYPTDNAFHMHNNVAPTAYDRLIVGSCVGFLSNDLIYDKSFECKEDYELSLRLISQGRHTLRFNRIAAIYDFKAKGGCESVYAKGGLWEASIKIVNKYPHLVTLKNKGTEIRRLQR